MTMRTDGPTLARIEVLVGNRQMAKFIREAVIEKLEREETARGIVPPTQPAEPAPPKKRGRTRRS